MNMKALCGYLFASIGLIGLTPPLVAAEPVAKKPNVILIFSDDQRADTIHALGNDTIHTPNLDRLVREGTSFSNAYMMGAMTGATCVPSRAQLLSGRSVFRLQGIGRVIPENHATIPETLKAQGYATYWVGKSHQKQSSMGRMFDGGDRCYGYHGPYRAYDHYLMAVQDFDPNGKFDAPRYIYKKDADGREVKTEVNREIFSQWKRIKDKESEFFHTSEVFSTGAVKFLKSYKKEQPFFMYLAYHSPHDPVNAAKRFHELYPPEKMSLPVNFMKQHPFDNGELQIRDEKLAAIPRVEREIKQQISNYYAIISQMDEQIGRVLKALDETGLAENTIIIFSSDSGLALGSHGLMGKQNVYEDTAKVPLIMAGPGIPKGNSDALAYTMDLFPTICDLVGAPIPQGLDGESLVPVIDGEEPEVRKTLFYAYRNVQRAVRNDRWKIIRYPEIKRTQLFDLKNDPDETKDLSGSPEQAERIKKMMDLMQQWQTRLGDTLPQQKADSARSE